MDSKEDKAGRQIIAKVDGRLKETHIAQRSQYTLNGSASAVFIKTLTTGFIQTPVGRDALERTSTGWMYPVPLQSWVNVSWPFTHRALVTLQLNSVIYGIAIPDAFRLELWVSVSTMCVYVYENICVACMCYLSKPNPSSSSWEVETGNAV